MLITSYLISMLLCLPKMADSKPTQNTYLPILSLKPLLLTTLLAYLYSYKWAISHLTINLITNCLPTHSYSNSPILKLPYHLYIIIELNMSGILLYISHKTSYAMAWLVYRHLVQLHICILQHAMLLPYQDRHYSGVYLITI